MNIFKAQRCFNQISKRHVFTRHRLLSTDVNGPLNEALALSPGTELHGYTVKSVDEVTDFNLVAVQLHHDNTGARHIHVARKDSNNTFGVGFKTVPMDSTGVAHILEHTTLCGSQSYPVRDPFFKMLTRSLQTFMNAFTSTDWTLFPFSSQNPKDYRNLLSVYLDCTFRPLLKESDFSQEGWRLEHKDVNDRGSPLMFRGVVYNEMKGVFANSENLFTMELQRKLLPSHTYSHYYGGIPANILDLSWQQLKDFHSNNYHPSKSRFYTYGDFPLSSHLEYINESVLSQYSQGGHETIVPNETRWTQPRVHTISCAPDPMAPDPNKQTTVGVAYMLGSVTDPYEGFIQSLIGKLLIDGPASPFYQSLLDSNIGADYSPGTGYSNHTKDCSFSIGLQKIALEDVNKVQEIIQKTFEKAANEGFSEARVKAMLHQIEMSLKHQSSNFGLSLMMVMLPPWFHEADPVEMLQVNKVVNRFKQHLEDDPEYLQKKIREYFLENQHRLTLIMTPEDNYETQVKAVEEAKLKQLVDSLSNEDKEKIYQQGLTLQSEQNQLQDVGCLPTVTISDVNRTSEQTVVNIDYSEGVPVQYCQQPTNGLVYFRALSGCENLPHDLQLYLPLFTEVITRMGAGGMNHRSFAEQCDLYTGGSLSVGTHVTPHHTKTNTIEQAVDFSSHCLDRHLPYMLSLWEDVFTEPDLRDLERLRTLVTMAASSLSMAVADRGHGFAMTAAASSLSPAAMLAETFGGISQVKFLKDIAESQDLTDVLQKLSSIAVHVMDTGCMRCAVNTTPDQVSTVSHAMDGFIDALPGGATDTMSFMMEIDHTPTSSHTHYNLPFPIYYVGQSYGTVPYTHIDSAHLLVLARLLSWKYLHKEIREKGGAYGGGAQHGNGIFSFYSYRDPNSLDTINRFQDSIQWAVNGSFTEDDVHEAKLSVFSQVDSPVSPSSKGTSIFYNGITHDLKQQRRDRLFKLTKEDLISVAKRYLQDTEVTGSVIIGPEVANLPSHWKQETFKL